MMILSLHYLVKCRSRSLAVYYNEFIPIAHAWAQKITETTKSLEICNSFNINRIDFYMVGYVDELK